jgi:transketolase
MRNTKHETPHTKYNNLMNDAVSSAELREIARRLRVEALKMVYKAQSGHCGGPLSAADIVATLYWRVMNIRPEDPRWPNRDRFVLSKGHSCPVLYAALALKGYFERPHLETLRQFGSILQGHPSMKHTPGLDMSTGSLGQGLSVACGMALGGRQQRKDFRVYVMLSDGELDEGMIWEAAMFANHFKLNTVTAFIDHNGLQMDGTNDEIMSLHPLPDKWRAFGWNVITCDGHDVDAITEAIEAARACVAGPSVIIAETVKGKGVGYMEHVGSWHGAPAVWTEAEFLTAMQDLGEPEGGGHV